MLLQKIREMNRNGNTDPNIYTYPPYSVLGNEAEELKETPKESTCSHQSHHLREDKQSSHAQFEYRNPQMESPPTTQQSTVKKPKQLRHVFFLYSFSTSLTINKYFNHDDAFVSDQQRQEVKQTSQREQHQHILKRLEIHRPTKSVHQKQPAAERTDVLYDFVSAIKLLTTTLQYLETWPTLINTCFSGSITSAVNQHATSRC